APGCRHLADSSSCTPLGECFTASCDPIRGCQQSPRIGQTCHAGSLCQVGRCTSFGCNIEINLCNDGNACTTDTCVDPSTGTCAHANNTVPCNDGNSCTTGDTCSGGTCQGSSTTNCDDGNVCTTDACSATQP